jgi:hypothetical protein
MVKLTSTYQILPYATIAVPRVCDVGKCLDGYKKTEVEG